MLTSRSLIRIVCLCGFLYLSAPALFAASNSIQGHVTDPTGAAIVNAEILLDKDGQTVRQTATVDNGEFIFDDLWPGMFIIKISVAGFEDVNQTVTVTSMPFTAEIQLRIAVKQQTVVVTANRTTTIS